MTVLELTAKRAAKRQYLMASEKLADKAVDAFFRHKSDTARAFALFANDVRRWARQECD